MKFYEKLIILRKKALLSQEELAEKLDVTRQTISKWELGQSKPDIDKLQMMSKLFEVDVNTLTNEEISLEDKVETKEHKNNKKEDGDRKFILYILIIIFIASLAFLTYRVGTDIKAKKDEIKEELRKEKEKAEKKQEEEECPIESTTCGMDTTKKLSEEKNKELMQHGLDNLSDLL